jgi:hypothetical protein
MQGGWLIQRLAFCVHKWIQSHGAQGVIGPDGFFYDWFDGPVSRHGDRYFANESKVNETLTQLQLNDVIQYIIYGDKGYTAKSHMLCYFTHTRRFMKMQNSFARLMRLMRMIH